MEYRIYFRDEISASHWLDLPYPSKCKNLHGHNYKVEIWITSEELDRCNMVMDFNVIKQAIKMFDHGHLNDILNTHIPTAELLARRLLIEIRSRAKNKIKKIRIRVWEDERSYAEVIQ